MFLRSEIEENISKKEKELFLLLNITSKTILKNIMEEVCGKEKEM